LTTFQPCPVTAPVRSGCPGVAWGEERKIPPGTKRPAPINKADPRERMGILGLFIAIYILPLPAIQQNPYQKEMGAAARGNPANISFHVKPHYKDGRSPVLRMKATVSVRTASNGRGE
jgi:hypothetical protein